jgi:putative serine protease PepD
MTDHDDASYPQGGDTDPGPWWTPPPASTGGRFGSRDSGESARSSSPSWTLLALISAVTALLGGTIGGIVAHHAASSGSESAPETVRLGAPAQPVTSSHRGAVATAAVAAKILPSVVSIEVRRGSGGDTGSGIVISSSGYILTNNHVVQPALNGGKLTVVFHDKHSVHGEIVGRDRVSDLAVVRVRGVKGLEPAVLGSSSAVAVGDPVIAVGSPLGLAGTVTSGIVSALDRPVEAGSVDASTDDIIDAIQTDAAINPGNSGGPLVDGNGAVIGVNSAIATLSADTLGGGQGGSIGLGFAIPIDQAKRIAQQIITQGFSTHAIIGVRLDPRYAGEGAKIAANTAGNPGVTPGGPAGRAGLRAGDVVVEVDGVPVTSADELIVAIRRHVPGQHLTLTYLRDRARHTAVVTLGSAPSD